MTKNKYKYSDTFKNFIYEAVYNMTEAYYEHAPQHYVLEEALNSIWDEINKKVDTAIKEGDSTIFISVNMSDDDPNHYNFMFPVSLIVLGSLEEESEEEELEEEEHQEKESPFYNVELESDDELAVYTKNLETLAGGKPILIVIKK